MKNIEGKKYEGNCTIFDGKNLISFVGINYCLQCHYPFRGIGNKNLGF